MPALLRTCDCQRSVIGSQTHDQAAEPSAPSRQNLVVPNFIATTKKLVYFNQLYALLETPLNNKPLILVIPIFAQVQQKSIAPFRSTTYMGVLIFYLKGLIILKN